MNLRLRHLSVATIVVLLLTLDAVAKSPGEAIAEAPRGFADIRGMKIWITTNGVAPGEPCDLDVGAIIRPIFAVVKASSNPKMEFWTNGQPRGVALHIEVVTQPIPGTRLCASTTQGELAFREPYKADGPRAKLVYAEYPPLFSFGSPRRGTAAASDSIDSQAATAVSVILLTALDGLKHERQH